MLGVGHLFAGGFGYNLAILWRVKIYGEGEYILKLETGQLTKKNMYLISPSQGNKNKNLVKQLNELDSQYFYVYNVPGLVISQSKQNHIYNG